MPGQDVYSATCKGPLKLKGVKDSSIKKKKKKKSKKELPSGAEEQVKEDSCSRQSDVASSGLGYSAQRTKAELHFMARQREREEARIKNKASKSHKEKVEQFNRNLDSQSEHFDIPKVSWTK